MVLCNMSDVVCGSPNLHNVNQTETKSSVMRRELETKS